MITWLHRCRVDKWKLFCDICPNKAKLHSELPNWARDLMMIKTKKGKDSELFIPSQVASAVDSLVVTSLKDHQEVTKQCVRETFRWALEIYQQEAKQVNALVFACF